MKTSKLFKSIASLTLVLAMVAGIALPYVSVDAAKAPTKVSITSSTKSVAVGKTLKLKAKLTPKKAKSKITWSTSNKAVATVKNGTVTGKKAGTATITAKTANGKTAKTTITVTGGTVTKGTVLWDQSKEKTAANRVVVRKYDEFKYHVSAIWLCPYNLYYDGRDKNVGEAVDNLGRKLRVQGEFKMDGPDAKEVIVQLNYTQPESYPVIKQYPDIKGGKWYKVNFTFTIPKNAVNGDKDSATGYNWPILLYFANKPNNKMIYKAGNNFTFRKFKITVVK